MNLDEMCMCLLDGRIILYNGFIHVCMIEAGGHPVWSSISTLLQIRRRLSIGAGYYMDRSSICNIASIFA